MPPGEKREATVVVGQIEAHRSLRAAGGGEPLSPDIHPIIIKLSLQGDGEGCLQRQPTRKQEGRRHQIHSC